MKSPKRVHVKVSIRRAENIGSRITPGYTTAELIIRLRHELAHLLAEYDVREVTLDI